MPETTFDAEPPDMHTPRTLLALAAGLLAAAAAAAEVTDKDAAALAAKFKAERAAAAQRYPGAVGPAGRLAGHADAYRKGGDPLIAARLYRRARWLLPYRPAGLPEDVRRVIGQTRLRHGDAVTALAFTADGSRFVSGSEDGSVKVWDMANGRDTLAARGMTAPDDGNGPRGVTSADVSPDGKLIAASFGKTVRLIDAATGKAVRDIKSDNLVNAVAFSPDGRRVVAAGDDRSARVYGLDGKAVGTFGPQTGRVMAASFAPDGEACITGNNRGIITYWDAREGKAGPLSKPTPAHADADARPISVAFAAGGRGAFSAAGTKVRLTGVPASPNQTAPTQREFDGHVQDITSLAASADGRYVAAGASDGSVRVWEAATAAPVRTYRGHTGAVKSLAFTPDGKFLASGGADQSIRLWELEPINIHRRLDDAEGYVWSVAYRPGGKQFASAGADGKVRVHDADTGKVALTLVGHGKAVTAVAYSPGGKFLASAGGDKLVKIWDADTGKAVRDLAGHAGPVLSLAYAPDGSRLLSGGADRRAILWNPADGKEVKSFAENPALVTAVAVTRDGSRALIGTADGSLLVAPVEGDGPKAAARAHEAGVADIALSPADGTFATAGGDGLVRVWSLGENGRPAEKATLAGHKRPVSSIAYSPGGELIASAGGDRAVRLWDVDGRKEKRSLGGHTDWVGAVAFAPDGARLATGGVDKTVRLWELAGPAEEDPDGHAGAVSALAVAADGKTLYTASDDGAVKAWGLRSGRELRTLFAGPARVAAMALAPDGKALAVGADDYRLRLLDPADGKELRGTKIDNPQAVWFTQGGGRVMLWEKRRLPAVRVESLIRSFDPKTAEQEMSVMIDDGRDNAFGDNVGCADVSADGRLAAVGSREGGVTVWDLKSRERLKGFTDEPAHRAAGDLGFTPDGKRLVTAGGGDLAVWDVEAGKELKRFKVHPEAKDFYTLRVGPAGKRVATVSRAGVVRLWDLAAAGDAPKPLREWRLPTGVKQMKFAPGGKSLLTANADSTVYVLDLPE